MTKPSPDSPPAPDTEAPDVPGLRSWRGVYLFVLGSFVAYVVLLALFTAVFNR